MLHRQTLVYVNRTDEVAELILEPWGEVYLVDCGKKIYVVGVGGAQGSAFEVHQRPNGMSIFAWSDSVVTVEDEGGVMNPSSQA